MQGLEELLMEYSRETTGLKDAKKVFIDEENGFVYFQIGDYLVEKNILPILAWASQKLKTARKDKEDQCLDCDMYNKYGQ